MVVRELVAMLGVKSDKAGMKQAESGMGKLVSVAKAAAVAFAALKLVQFFKNLIKEVTMMGDRFDKMSKRSGIAAEELQKLGYAAQLSGASISDMETGIKRLQAAQVEAIDGVATYKDEFKRMGVEVKNTDGSIKDTSQLLVEMADGMKNLETDAERTAVAMKLLGRGGAQLIPLLKQGSEAVKEQMEEFVALGAVMDQELVEASAEFVDNQLRMDSAIQGVKNSIVKELLPVLNETIDGFVDWWKVNGQIIRQKVAVVFKNVFRVLVGLAKHIKWQVDLFVKWVDKLSPLEKGLLAVGAAITIIGAIIKKGPIGKILLLAAIIALIIDDFQTWKEGGDSLFGDLVDWLDEVLGFDLIGWVEDIIVTFEKLWLSIKAGAGSVLETLFAFGNLLFKIFTGEDPKEAWNAFVHEIELIWDELMEFVKTDGSELVTWFEENFVAPILDFFIGLWKDIETGFLDVYNSLVQWATDVITEIMKPFEKAKELIDKLTGGGGGDTKVKIKTIEEQLGGLKVIGGGGQTTPKTTQARPGAQGTTVINKPSTNIQVDVKGGPGTSATAIANEAAKKISQAMDNQNRRTLKAFTPAAGGGSPV